MLPWMSTAWFGMSTKLPGRTRAFGRNEKAAGSRFEDRDAQDIADAEGDVARPLILLEGGQARQVLGQDLDDFRGKLDDRVVEAHRVALTRQYVRGGRAAHRHPAAAAQRRHQGHAQRERAKFSPKSPISNS